MTLIPPPHNFIFYYQGLLLIAKLCLHKSALFDSSATKSVLKATALRRSQKLATANTTTRFIISDGTCVHVSGTQVKFYYLHGTKTDMGFFLMLIFNSFLAVFASKALLSFSYIFQQVQHLLLLFNFFLSIMLSSFSLGLKRSNIQGFF